MKPFWLKCKQLSPFAKLPTRGSEFAAGYDVYSTIATTFNAGSLVKFPLGFAAAFTEGYGAFVWDRSGMGVKDVIRRAGLLDSDYRGEWAIVLKNDSNIDLTINVGDRIAQIVFQEVAQEDAEWVDKLPDSIRGTGGFGSTGR